VTAAGDIEHPLPDLRLDKFLRKQLARPSRAEGKGVKTTAFSFTAGPMVRIRFPPAVSLQTFGPSREELPFVQQPAAALYAPVQPDRSSALSLCNGFDRPVCPRRRLNVSMNYGIRNDLIVATAASGNSSWIDSFPCGSSLSSAPGAAAKASISARDLGGVRSP